MLSMCAVVDCHSGHCKDSVISFYGLPTDAEKCHKLISFVSRQNTDVTAWKPEDRHHVFSEHFMSKRKFDLHNSPD